VQTARDVVPVLAAGQVLLHCGPRSIRRVPTHCAARCGPRSARRAGPRHRPQPTVCWSTGRCGSSRPTCTVSWSPWPPRWGRAHRCGWSSSPTPASAPTRRSLRDRVMSRGLGATPPAPSTDSCCCRRRAARSSPRPCAPMAPSTSCRWRPRRSPWATTSTSAPRPRPTSSCAICSPTS
jgi:hypothetical protein